MPRRRVAAKREILPDPIYNSKIVSKFINSIMSDGEKAVAARICYGAFDIIKDKTSDDPLKIFKTALENVKPSLEVKSRRVGGATYQVPIDVRPQRRIALAFRWIITHSQITSRYDQSQNSGCSVNPHSGDKYYVPCSHMVSQS